MLKEILFSNRSYIYFLYSLFSITLGLIFYHTPIFINLIKKIPKRILLLLLTIFIFSLSLRIWVIPHRHQVFNDEFHFINVAQNIYYHGLYGSTVMGNKYTPEKIIFYNRPGGYPLLLSGFYCLLGESDETPFRMNSILGGLSIGILFLILFLLFKNLSIAAWGSFIASIHPLHLKYGASASSDQANFFFIAFSIFIYLLYIRQNKQSLFYLLGILLVFASYIKPENLFFILILLGFALLQRKENKKISLRLFFDWSYFIICLSLPLIIQMNFIARAEKQNAQGAFWSFKYLAMHFQENLRYIFDYRYNLFAAIIFLIIGMLVCYKKNKKTFFILASWFVGSFIIYTGYFGGILYDRDRYLLLTIIPFCILAGAGVCAFIDRCYKNNKIVIACLIIMIFCINAYLSTRTILEITSKRIAYKEYEFLKNEAVHLGDNYFIGIDPAFIVSGLNKKGIRPGDFLDTKLTTQKEAYLIRSIHWQDSLYGKYEDLLKKSYDFTIVAQKDFREERSTTIFKLTKKNIS